MFNAVLLHPRHMPSEFTTMIVEKPTAAPTSCAILFPSNGASTGMLAPELHRHHLPDESPPVRLWIEDPWHII
jgi:hypothetical protein